MMALKFRRATKLKNAFLDQAGSMTFFVIIMFTTMIGVAGVAIDVARFEATRSEIQAHMDNATLAAASLRQSKDPQVIIDSYMAKAGLSGKYTVVVTNPDSAVNSTNTLRRVETQGTITLDTMFMSLFGVDDLGLTVNSTAEESVPRIEVSLVLDISGSMGSNSRLTNLIPAAQDFIDLLLEGNSVENPNRVSISLIPYNMQVNAGQELFTRVKTDYVHNHSHCAEWDSASFSSLDFQEDGMEQSMVMGWYNSGDTWGYGTVDQPYCRDDEFAQILPVSNDAAALKAQIGLLQARGNTSIDIGVKWGLALLDPSANPVISDMTTLYEYEKDDDGDDVLDDQGNPVYDFANPSDRQAIDPGFDDRPTSYSDDETVKILVVMTDGQNTTEYRIKDGYRDTGNSGVYHRASDDSYRFSNSSGYTQLNWIEMWAAVPVVPYAHYKTGSYRNYTTYWDYSLGNTAKNTRLSDVCAAARQEVGGRPKVTIYSIAYSATSDGESALRDCSGADNFHTATTSTIADAFSQIGGDIQKLRLAY
jgi:Mg-chelatase subunit ChlD